MQNQEESNRERKEDIAKWMGVASVKEEELPKHRDMAR